VFARLISLFIIVSRRLYVSRIISCERLTCFTSIITRITSWDTSERSPYLFSWYGRLSALFYVIVGCYIDSGLVVMYLRLWLHAISWSAGLVHIWW